MDRSYFTGSTRGVEQVSQTLHNWHEHNRQHSAEIRSRKEIIRFLAFAQLLERLHDHKQPEQATLLKDPASDSDIRDTEERLNIKLPDDYKVFMRLSNGLDTVYSLDKPGLRPLQDLKWTTAEKQGLDEFRVNLGKDPDPKQWNRGAGYVTMVGVDRSNESLDVGARNSCFSWRMTQLGAGSSWNHETMKNGEVDIH